MGLIPVTTLLVPVVFTLREGFPRLLMVRVDPTLVTNANARPAGRGGMEQDGGDPGAWISEVVAPQLRGATLTSRFHPLLPRPMRGGRLAIPAWTTARTDAARGDGLQLVDAAEGLDGIGNELGDPDFGRQVLAAVRATLASDPFAQRVMGDGAFAHNADCARPARAPSGHDLAKQDHRERGGAAGRSAGEARQQGSGDIEGRRVGGQ